MSWRPRRTSPHDAAIFALTWPTLGALIAEPLFIVTDTALVGHLGVAPLAALGLAAAVIQTVVGMSVFLAYATTPVVARRLGAGDTVGAMRAGIDGLTIAAIVGAVVAVAVALAAEPIIGWFSPPTPEIAAAAADYLRVGMVGVPAMLLVFAATGVFRGFKDAKTPLWLTVGGFGANAALNALLIYVPVVTPEPLGLIGSAIGTSIAQWGMAIVAVALVLRRAQRLGALRRRDRSASPGVGGSVASMSGWLVLRSVSMRVVILGQVVAATAHGEDVLAATQVLFTIFTLVAFILDALAIAGQPMIGEALGAGDTELARGVLRRLVELSVAGGLALGILLAALAWPLAHVFTSDAALIGLIAIGTVVIAVGLPIGAPVWALDGVLIGAGDARFLALAQGAVMVAMVPLLWWLVATPMDPMASVIGIQVAFAVVFMGLRLLSLWPRAAGSRWVRTGA